MKKILLLIGILVLFTGCYDYNELNDLAIVSGMAVAYEDGKYKTTFEIVNTKKNESGQSEEKKSIIITASGDNPSQSIHNTIAKADKKLLFSHLQVVLLDESMAKKGIEWISNFLFRDIRTNNNFYYVLVQNAEAKDVFDVKIENESIISNAIIGMFNNQNDIGIIDANSQFDYLYAKLKDKKEDIIIPSITLEDKKITLSTPGVFKEDKLKGYLTKNEASIYYLLKSKVENSFFDKEDSAITIYNNKAKFKVEDKKTISIILNAQAKIECLNKKDTNLRDTTMNKELTKIYSQEIKNDIKELVKKSIEIESDFLGLNSVYYRKYPNLYKNDIYKELDYNIETTVEVNRNGKAFEVIE